MANKTEESTKNSVTEAVHSAEKSEVVQTAEKKAKPFQQFMTKFNNDWSMTFAAGLAYNLLMSVFPIVIALVAILGLILNSLSPAAYTSVINSALSAFPKQTGAQPLLLGAIDQVKKDAGILTLIAVILALFNGSRLFIYIEGVFDIIYHVRPRNMIPQNIMALVMMVVFIILLPIMVATASAPTFVLSLLRKTPIGSIPGIGILFTVSGIVGGVLAAFLLFLVIYIVVPNQKIRLRNSWLGALVAAVLLQLFLILFPLYISHFFTGYAGTIGLIILLVFFYYFGVILFLGAEVNAFFAEKIKATPDNLAVMVHKLTSHLAPTEQDVKQQAAADHKNVQPKEIRPKHDKTNRTFGKTTSTTAQDQSHTKGKFKPEKEKSPSRGFQVGTIVEATAGIALAFLIELFRLRRRRT
jgi:membrane protein